MRVRRVSLSNICLRVRRVIPTCQLESSNGQTSSLGVWRRMNHAPEEAGALILNHTKPIFLDSAYIRPYTLFR